MAVGYESHGKVVEELYKLRERVGITRAKVAECEVLRHLPAVEAQFKVYPSGDERTAAAYALITCLVNTAHHMSESQQMVLLYGLRIGPIRDCSATSYQKRLDLALDEEPAIGGRKNFSEGSYAEYVANCFEHFAQVLIQVAESPCDGKFNVDDAALRKQQHLDDIIRSSFDIEAIAQGRKAAASWIRQGGPDGLASFFHGAPLRSSEGMLAGESLRMRMRARLWPEGAVSGGRFSEISLSRWGRWAGRQVKASRMAV